MVYSCVVVFLHKKVPRTLGAGLERYILELTNIAAN